ncbi:CvpA family protein [Candidatus Omnitrophota bacterium]
MEFLKYINWVDIVVIVLLLRAVFLGAKKGLTAELFNFFGIILSLVIATQWYSRVADILVINLNLPVWIAQFTCFVIIAQLIRVVFKYGIALIFKILNIQFIPQLERIGGGILGLGRGIIIAGILLLALGFLPVSYISDSIYDKSYSGIFIIKAANRTYKGLTFWLPESRTETSIFHNMPAFKEKKRKPS